MKAICAIGLLVLLSMNVACDLIREQEKNTLNEAIDSLQFIEYKEFEAAYKSGRDRTQLSEDFDLTSMLLLDSTLAKEFFKINKELTDKVRYRWLGSKLSERTVGFSTESETRRGLLLSKTAKNRIFSCVYVEAEDFDGLRIWSPICIKDNAAVIEVVGSTSLDVYYVRLLDGIVQIDMLERTIE